MAKDCLPTVVILALLTFPVFASGASSQSPPVTSTPKSAAQTKVTINGKPRTCGELICENPKGCGAAAKCNDNYQRSFGRWGSRIDAYVTSGRLGPLGNEVGTIDAPRPGSRWRYQDVAAAGLAACFIADRGGNEDKFIDYMLDSHPEEDRVVFLPLWFGAQRYLCSDVKFPSALRGGEQQKQPGSEADLSALAEATQRNEPILIARTEPPPPTRGGASATLELEPNEQVSYQEYAADLRLTFQSLERYWSQALPNVFGRAFTRTGPYHQYGATGAPHAAVCAGRALAPNNAFYCPDNDSIHWHGPFVVGLYQSYGDFAAAYVWAHEYSHAMQRRLGLLTANRFSIQRELEADCFAGAWASWAEKVAKILEPGDIDEALRVMFDIRDRVGTPWFDSKAHGTAQDRIRSFNIGYDKGTPKACLGS